MAASTSASAQLAGRYATALFDIADEKRSLDTVSKDMSALQMALNESADLMRLIRSPALKRDQQSKAMQAVLNSLGVSDIARNFIGVVARNGRLFALPAMIQAFLDELAKRRGEVTAEVTAARPLSEAQQEALTDRLKETVGQKVSVQVTVDPSILGGLVVKVGSRMIDSSVKTKLQRLQLALTSAS